MLQVRDGTFLPQNNESDAPASFCAKLGAGSVDREMLFSSARRGRARLTEVECATNNGAEKIFEWLKAQRHQSLLKARLTRLVLVS